LGIASHATGASAYGHSNRYDSLDNGQCLIGKRRRCRSVGAVPMPPGFEDHLVCSDRLGKFSTLPDSSTAYQNLVLVRSDRFRPVLNIELSRFYHSASGVPAGRFYGSFERASPTPCSTHHENRLLGPRIKTVTAGPRKASPCTVRHGSSNQTIPYSCREASSYLILHRGWAQRAGPLSAHRTKGLPVRGVM
jgi:hypothetical protein